MNLFQKIKLLIQLNKLTEDKSMLEKLKSRKLWATVIAGALATIGQQVGISTELITTLVQLVMVYVGSQAVVDAATARKDSGK